jgi:hypothetical protein
MTSSSWSRSEVSKDFRHFPKIYAAVGAPKMRANAPAASSGSYNRGSGRFDFAVDGTFTSASPSSTTWSATLQMKPRALAFGNELRHRTVTSTASPILTGARKLSDCEVLGSHSASIVSMNTFGSAQNSRVSNRLSGIPLIELTAHPSLLGLSHPIAHGDDRRVFNGIYCVIVCSAREHSGAICQTASVRTHGPNAI